jgi:hypothetical protein
VPDTAAAAGEIVHYLIDAGGRDSEDCAGIVSKVILTPLLRGAVIVAVGIDQAADWRRTIRGQRSASKASAKTVQNG